VDTGWTLVKFWGNVAGLWVDTGWTLDKFWENVDGLRVDPGWTWTMVGLWVDRNKCLGLFFGAGKGRN
jgi:hypothetical protein